MRDELKKLDKQRMGFTGTFSRTDKVKNSHPPEPTLLLLDIRDEGGRVVADHVWLLLTKEFAALGLKEGDRIGFVATVSQYFKGNCEKDYYLTSPGKIRKIDGAAEDAGQGGGRAGRHG
jgi:hypothetical protein